MSLARFFSSEPSIFSNEFRSLFNEIDRAIGSSWPGTSLASSTFTDYQFVPRVRLSEEGERYKVEAEVPGFPKESLNLQFQDDYTLLLSGKYEQETREGPEQQELSTDQGQQQQQQQQAAKQDQGNGKPASTAVSKSGDKQVSTNIQQPRVWRNERISQSFQRQIVFPTAVNQDAVEASLDHGLLKLAVPKLAEEKHRKRITIA